MKLNLLPTYVSKEKATRNAVILGVLLFAVCVLGSVLMILKSNGDYEASKEEVDVLQAKALKAKETADYADTVMSNSTILLRNAALAESMMQHSKAYPDLYDEVRRSVPSFFRVTSMSAQPVGPGQSSVTVTGVLDSYQQYADLMLAMLRMRGVTAIGRSGFTNTDMYVPAPTPTDQIGKPRRPGEAPIPDDPLERLEYLRGKAGSPGYTGEGGFGSGVQGTRGAMPGESVVTITLAVQYDLQTPDPAATLNLNKSAGGGGGGTGPGPSAAGNQTPAGMAAGGDR
jgi:hypothetical protein